MSIYTQIDSNKRKTNLLLFGFFGFTVALVSTLLYLAEALPLVEAIVVSAVGSALYCLISYYASGSAVLMTQGAKEVDKNTAFELVSMVESLAIGAGVPMPKVYVINDPAPNAFATGRDPKHAAVAVTTGLLSMLNRDELKGVLAHEVSHIKNFDIRVMTIVVVLVGLVVLVSDVALRVGLFGGNNRDNKDGRLVIFFIVFALISAVLAPLIGNLIRFAVSRTREYLADTSGAHLTLQPQHLASALAKIGSYSAPMKRANHATAHLFISNPFGKAKRASVMNRLFSTHPPIEDRIAKLNTIYGDR
jgi:heat shock protein HtpX